MIQQKFSNANHYLGTDLRCYGFSSEINRQRNPYRQSLALGQGDTGDKQTIEEGSVR